MLFFDKNSTDKTFRVYSVDDEVNFPPESAKIAFSPKNGVTRFSY